MNQAPFAPQNELEKNLLSALEGALPGDDFISYLMDAQIFMPVADEPDRIKGFQRSTRAQPLVLQDDEGGQVLILFTSPERAREFVREFPAYGGGLLTEFSWVLRRIGTPARIALNPGHEAGFDMDAEMVAALMAGLPQEA